MEPRLYKVKVSGSTMLLGEHAVLKHGLAVVCAINKYIELSVKLIETSSRPKCYVDALDFGNLEIYLDDFKVQAPFTFVLQVIEYFKPQLQTLSYDFEIKISSQFKATIGFGSSSAVTVGLTALLYKIINKANIENQELLRLSHHIICLVQGVGSGADLAASIYGGVIAYNAKTYVVEKLPNIPSFYLIYTGYKTPTPKVIAYVLESFKDKSEELERIYSAITDTVYDGIQAIKSGDYLKLKEIFSTAFSLQQQLTVSDKTIDQIVKLIGQGSKISGSGLGDCVITFNEVNIPEYTVYKIETSICGLEYVS